MEILKISVEDFEKLQQAMKEYQGNTEEAINEVLHGDASTLIQDSIRLLMPVSGANWAGKKAAAKYGKSLTAEIGNLFVTIKSTKAYQYLYFPDDGSNTRRHVGNQHFFERGGEAVQDNIIDLCINRLVNDFEEL